MSNQRWDADGLAGSIDGTERVGKIEGLMRSILRAGSRRVAALAGIGWLVLLSVIVGCSTSPSPVLTLQTAVPRSEATPTIRPTSTASPIPPTLAATLTLSPNPSRTPYPTSTPTRTKEVTLITMTVVYDNNPYDPSLTTGWGFACLIERPDLTLLFDTGGDGAVLLKNMETLDKDPAAVDLVMLSHEHGDHTGGLPRLLDVMAQTERPLPEVVVPTAFAPSFKAQIRERTELVEVSKPVNVRPGVWSTGQVDGPVNEQAVAIRTTAGWVVVTGCAHPGVEAMTERALEATGGPITLVVGGYHLRSASTQRIERTIKALQAMDVDAVGPTHCTGDKARAMFAKAYGDGYHEVGVGYTLEFEYQP